MAALGDPARPAVVPKTRHKPEMLSTRGERVAAVYEHRGRSDEATHLGLFLRVDPDQFNPHVMVLRQIKGLPQAGLPQMMSTRAA